ncbi:MAG: sialidase family protein [Pyrinomonadaceae bacterium]
MKENKLGRREFLAASGGIAGLIVGSAPSAQATTTALSVPTFGEMERFTLDLGHRASRSGPITSLKNGDLLWVTTEPEAPYLSKSMWSISRLVMRRSTDGGKSWGGAKVLQQGTTDYSLLSHNIRQTAAGTLLHIFVRYSGYDYDTGTPEKSLSEVFIERSSDEGKTWGRVEKMPTGERYQGDILSMEQLRDGRLIYPFCFLTNVKSQFAVSVMYSDDDAKTWKRSSSVLRTGGGGFESGASEPTVVELPDGRLWMLIRAQTGFLWQSFSTDRGATWSPAVESTFPSSNAPATALRLRSGEIAVAWNNHTHSNYARQSILIGLTKDGKTFQGLRELDFTDFTDDPNASIPHVTYAFLTETKDGDLAISYNKGNWSRHNRPTFARVSRSWILEKDVTADLKDGRTGWHTVDPGPSAAAAVERYVRAEDDSLWLEIEQHARNQNPVGIVRNIPMVTDGEIRVRVQAGKSDGYILFGNSLLSPRDPNDAAIRLRFSDDKIYVAAGVPDRQQNNRRTTEFFYLAYRIGDEKQYPAIFKPGETLDVSVKYNAASSSARVAVNGGAPVDLKISKIFGLTFMGVLAANGGQVRVHSVRTILS